MIAGGSMADTGRARELLERGSYKDAAEAFLRIGEFASAARAFVCAQTYDRAAQCYEMATKPLDAARLYLQVRNWKKAAQLYAQAGDHTREELALEQLRLEDEARGVKPKVVLRPPGSGQGRGPAPPPPEEEPWPKGEIWTAIRQGDFPYAAQIYTRQGTPSGWNLLAEAPHAKAFHGLGESLALAREYAIAGECFRRSGETLRAAQTLSLAGMNAEAADLFLRADQKVLAAQHLEKIHDWRSAAQVYRDSELLLDAARCHEKDDEPVKAAGLYLKAKKPDLALPLLQAVSPHHRLFAQCRLLAAKILYQKNQHGLAASLLEPLLQASPRGEADLDATYQAALLLEQGGEADKAREVYEKLQRLRFGYRDVEARLKRAASEPPTGRPPLEALPPSAPELDLSPLRDCSLFNRLSLEDLRHLTAMGKILEPALGQVVLRGGHPDDGLYVVLSGGLAITPDASQPGLAVGFLGPGDFVGLGSLVMSPPRANDLVAQPGTTILLLPRETLDPLLDAQPDLGLRLYRSVAEHLAQTLKALKSG